MSRRLGLAVLAIGAGLTACVREPQARVAEPPTRSILFDTAQADAVVAGMQIFPPDNPWNQSVTDWPVHPNSAAIVASVGRDKPLRMNSDMNYVIVPPDQPLVPFTVTAYPDQADAGPFPIPADLPIEGWPAAYRATRELRKLTLDDVQRDTANLGGDRHAIVVDPKRGVATEFFSMKKTAMGWEGFSAQFDLTSNKLRPDGWTSADAAGLPIFPAIVKHHELQRGRIGHALRVTVRRTRKAYVAPATHFASRLTDADLPRMGERFRLRKEFDTSKFTPAARAVLDALKTHGMLVADNGIEWAISVAPDARITPMHDEFRRVKGSDFEVVVAPAK